MPGIRTSECEQVALALDDLASIAEGSAGVSIDLIEPGDWVTINGIGHKPWAARVHARSSMSPREARALVSGEPQGAHVVVADQISAEAKEYLATVRNWGWLDRRNELRLRHGMADLEIRLPPRDDASRSAPGLALPHRRATGLFAVEPALVTPPRCSCRTPPAHHRSARSPGRWAWPHPRSARRSATSVKPA